MKSPGYLNIWHWITGFKDKPYQTTLRTSYFIFSHVDFWITDANTASWVLDVYYICRSYWGWKAKGLRQLFETLMSSLLLPWPQNASRLKLLMPGFNPEIERQTNGMQCLVIWNKKIEFMPQLTVWTQLQNHNSLWPCMYSPTWTCVFICRRAITGSPSGEDSRQHK